MFVLDFLLMHLSQFVTQLSVSENIPGQKNRSRNNDIVLSLLGCPMSLCNPFKSDSTNEEGNTSCVFFLLSTTTSL